MSSTRASTLVNGALAALAMAAVLVAQAAAAEGGHTTEVFKGGKVNVGTVTHGKEGGRNVLTLSEDFEVPDTPDPHWQVVDSKGNTYLLQRIAIKKEDKLNKTITVPAYVKDIAKVQIWCAWAETLLGEASFPKPVM